jgi:hypothetical protein
MGRGSRTTSTSATAARESASAPAAEVDVDQLDGPLEGPLDPELVHAVHSAVYSLVDVRASNDPTRLAAISAQLDSIAGITNNGRLVDNVRENLALSLNAPTTPNLNALGEALDELQRQLHVCVQRVAVGPETTVDDSDAACGWCGRPDDDGQGYDGLCGDCADFAEVTGKWSAELQ